MKNLRQKLAEAKLYCVTPEFGAQDYLTKVKQACRGGADIVQLRSKTLSAREFFVTALRLKEICSKYETIFIVNDRLDVALMSNADGVHLGQTDLPLREARKLARQSGASDDFIIGCSTHGLEQALRAQSEGADYLGCGPIFATPTKPDYKVVGLGLIGEYLKNIRIPFTTIGGINLQNIDQVLAAGAPCVAVLRESFKAADTEAATRQLKEKILKK